MGEMFERRLLSSGFWRHGRRRVRRRSMMGMPGLPWSSSRRLLRGMSASLPRRWRTERSSRSLSCGWRSLSRVAGLASSRFPSRRDRIVERALLVELDAVIDPLLLPWSFAYRHGLGVKDAIAGLTEARDEGAAWVARTDIDDCFERIPRWEVMRRLREVVPDLAVVDLVRKFMDRPVIGERVAYGERGVGLHQGSPLSPLLCNLYLDAFDRAMLRLGYRALRYADDIVIPVADRGSAERALRDAAEALQDLRPELDAGKTLTGSFGSGIDFLGVTVTDVTSPGAAALSSAGGRGVRGPGRGAGAEPG
jgi:Reverse transcriptase (RNA-dependent DNA polymerase)